MVATWARLRVLALDSVSELKELLEGEFSDDRRLISAYLDAKQALADAFEALSVEKYADLSVMDGAKQAVELEMRSEYPGLPAKYLKVRRFGLAHSRILTCLYRSIGTEVSGAELRMLTGDAVHTERRARELRDLGFTLDARHTGGVEMYILRTAEPDVRAGAATQVSKNIKGDKSTSTMEKEDLLRSVGLL